MASIVIIAYNEENCITKLLDSIKAQEYRKFEVILVDDHSTDRTVWMAQQYSDVFPLKIVQKEVKGPSRSRNYGAKFACGELLLFLDADIILPEHFLSRNIKQFIRQRLVLAGTDFFPITSSRTDALIAFLYRLWLKLVQFYNPRGIGFCMLVVKSFHQNLLFDESIIMSEDFDYIKRAVSRGKFRILNACLPYVSWRRFEKENRFLLVLKYLFFEWYRQNIGEIRRKLLPYDFDHSLHKAAKRT